MCVLKPVPRHRLPFLRLSLSLFSYRPTPLSIVARSEMHPAARLSPPRQLKHTRKMCSLRKGKPLYSSPQLKRKSNSSRVKRNAYGNTVPPLCIDSRTCRSPKTCKGCFVGITLSRPRNTRNPVVVSAVAIIHAHCRKWL